MVLQKTTEARVKIKEYGQVSCVRNTNSATLKLVLYLTIYRHIKQPGLAVSFLPLLLLTI